LTDAELRLELERSSPAWQDCVAALADARLQAPAGTAAPEITPEAGRHHVVQQELWRREDEGRSADP